jgi:hypothetical protein
MHTLLAIAACCAFGGCRKPRVERMETQPAAGALFVSDEPADGAQVSLLAVDRPDLKAVVPHAVVKSDGSFQLTTFATKDGAPVGKYALQICWPAPPIPGDDTEGPDRFRGFYANPQKPFKLVEIKPGENDLGRIDLP